MLGYPPSGREKATDLVLIQAGVVAEDWAENNLYSA